MPIRAVREGMQAVRQGWGCFPERADTRSGSLPVLMADPLTVSRSPLVTVYAVGWRWARCHRSKLPRSWTACHLWIAVNHQRHCTPLRTPNNTQRALSLPHNHHLRRLICSVRGRFINSERNSWTNA